LKLQINEIKQSFRIQLLYFYPKVGRNSKEGIQRKKAWSSKIILIGIAIIGLLTFHPSNFKILGIIMLIAPF